MEYYSDSLSIDSIDKRVAELDLINPGGIYKGIEVTTTNFSEIRKQLLLSILDSYRYDSYLKINKKDRFYLFMEYHHSLPEVTARYFYLAENAYDQGLISGELYALALDRVLSYAGFKQVYGSQVFNGKWAAVEDMVRLDSLRNEFGMENIRDYLERFSLKYSDYELAPPK